MSDVKFIGEVSLFSMIAKKKIYQRFFIITV